MSNFTMAFGGRSQVKMSDETFDFVCTGCSRENKTLEAVKYCLECAEYCCQSCTDLHKKMRILIGHNLTDVSQSHQATSQQPTLREFPTERCSIHKSKVIDMYCEYHDAVGCIVCFYNDHKSCQKSHIHSVPDMIDTIFKLFDCKQTHSLLKDMMVSMETRSKSKDTQLQALNKAKKETLDKVTTFQKALETILRKISESSKNEVEAVYKEIEKEILEEKHQVDTIHQDLQTTDDKLQKSEGNRAQRFVCSKMAQEKIKLADCEKNNQLQQNTNTQISFIPNQLLMEYIKDLQGIGQVQKHVIQKHVIQKHDHLYKIKGGKDININLPGDHHVCRSYGCCLTHDNKLLVVDFDNKKLKHIDLQKMSVVDYCTLDSIPRTVCCISKHEVAVACFNKNKIQFVSIDNKMTPTRHIKMSHHCFGIAVKDGKLYVTDGDKSLYVYDMTGTLLKTITCDNAGNKLFNNNRHVTFNQSGNRMFVGDGYNGLVCFDGMGNYLSTVTDTDPNYVDDLCVDGRGNMFVVGYFSDSVVQFSEDWKKRGAVVKRGDGLQGPLSVCFHQELNTMFVTMFRSNVVKMYELK